MSRLEIKVREFQMDFPTGRVAQRDKFTLGPQNRGPLRQLSSIAATSVAWPKLARRKTSELVGLIFFSNWPREDLVLVVPPKLWLIPVCV
jgi:hypothetical protein